MNNSCPEQRPLLNDENSDEELQIRSFNYQRRNLSTISKGRARIHAKGAAAVLTHWPDICSTSVTYWWIGVIMITISLFVIYNSVLIYGMIPTLNMKPPKYRNFNTGMKSKQYSVPLPNVYMHVIVENSADLHLNQYLPHINVVAKTYPYFKYNFLIVLNDTSKDIPEFNDNDRNEIALNSLWSNEKLNKKISSKYNISIEYISLTNYLNDSPVKKFWRHMPPHLIEFLLRSVSIWEKGGIAFNPLILTPKSPNSIYIEKLHELFYKYKNSRNKLDEPKPTTKVYSGVHKARPNNIQDIINSLYRDENNVTDLNVAETNIAERKNILQSMLTNTTKSDNYFQLNKNKTFHSVINPSPSNVSNMINNTYVGNLLPIFLKYIFHNKSKRDRPVNMSDSEDSKVSNNNRITLNDTIYSNKNNYVPSATTSEYRGKIKNNINIYEKNNKSDMEEHLTLLTTGKYEYVSKLTLDVKGNIIASRTACHAFLGTLFSNIIHHTEETITDFIMSELSVFCNGLLTSCPGVNVILV